MSGLLLWIAAMAVAATLAAGIAQVGDAAACAAQSQTAADAAALAGAAAGEGAARIAAQHNDAALVSLAQASNVFTATVQGCGDATVAHAQRSETMVTNRQME